MSNITFHKENNCLYLVQDLKDLNLYERTRAIENFTNKESKRFEMLVDNEILKIFRRNGVNVYSTEKSVLKRAFNTLKQKGKTIDTIDLYDKEEIFGCIKVKSIDDKCSFNIWLEDDRYLQIGVKVVERKV